jgi:hypothetical protein
MDRSVEGETKPNGDGVTGKNSSLGRSLDAFLNEVKGVTDVFLIGGDGRCAGSAEIFSPTTAPGALLA